MSKEEKNYKCRCGNAKSYRRAYSCYACWKKLPAESKMSMKKNQHSLRLQA